MKRKNPVEAFPYEVETCTEPDAPVSPRTEMDPWLEDLLAQKRRIAELQERLESLREAARECRAALKSAQTRLYSIIEDAEQTRLPLVH